MKIRIPSRISFRCALLIALAAVFLAAGCARYAAKEKPPIKIAINQWAGYAPAFLAEEKGFFKKNGVDVELVYNKSVPESLELFKSGEVDGCFSVFNDIVLMNSQGIGAKVVYAGDYSDEGDVIIARPEIKSLSGLKGKTASFEGVNTFSHFFVLKSLEKAGLGEADLKFANIKVVDVLQALKDGRIDAGHTWEPTKSQALKEGYKILAKAGDIRGMIIDILAFSPRIIQERPDDIKAIVGSLFEAQNYLKNNPEESIKIMAGKMEMSEEEMKEGFRGIYQPGLKENINILASSLPFSLHATGKTIINFYLERGQISSIPEIGNMIEPKFLEELSKQ